MHGKKNNLVRKTGILHVRNLKNRKRREREEERWRASLKKKSQVTYLQINSWYLLSTLTQCNVAQKTRSVTESF